LDCHPVAVVQYTFTHKQYIEQHNRHKQYIEQHKWQQNNTNNNVWKSADRAPSLLVIPWHLPYNCGKKLSQGKKNFSQGKTLSQSGRWNSPGVAAVVCLRADGRPAGRSTATGEQHCTLKWLPSSFKVALDLSPSDLPGHEATQLRRWAPTFRENV